MNVLTELADLRCNHLTGMVQIVPSQDFVRIDSRRILVEPDPVACRIDRCTNVGPTIKPCRQTVNVQTGYSTLVSIDGRPVCLDSVEGLSDGTPPGVVRFHVVDPGQHWVAEL